MRVEQLIRSPGSWLTRGKNSGIVLSSRVRLARNLRGEVFPGWGDEQTRVRVWHRLRDVIAGLSSVPAATVFDMGDVDDVDKAVLTERRLISPELAEQSTGSGVVISDSESLSVMVNEEDHLRLQAMNPGMDLMRVWHKVDAVDSELEAHVDYAYSHRLGYLTACPTNVGTGLRASVMLQLSGLKLTNEVDAVINGLDKLGVAVRGILGEGSEAFGNIFQISNQATLGESEEAIISRLTCIVEEVVEHERNARTRLMEARKTRVLDQIGRAFGVLSHARMVTSMEAVELLSALRLGLEYGVVKGLTVGRINQMMLWIQPGHLQRLAGKVLPVEDRDEVRARVMRQKLKNIGIDV